MSSILLDIDSFILKSILKCIYSHLLFTSLHKAIHGKWSIWFLVQNIESCQLQCLFLIYFFLYRNEANDSHWWGHRTDSRLELKFLCSFGQDFSILTNLTVLIVWSWFFQIVIIKRYHKLNTKHHFQHLFFKVL